MYTAGACLFGSKHPGWCPRWGGYLPWQSRVHTPPAEPPEPAGKQTWVLEKQQSKVFYGKITLVWKENSAKLLMRLRLKCFNFSCTQWVSAKYLTAWEKTSVVSQVFLLAALFHLQSWINAACTCSSNFTEGKCWCWRSLPSPLLPPAEMARALPWQCSAALKVLIT